MEIEPRGATTGDVNRSRAAPPLSKAFKDADIIGEEMFPVTAAYKEKHVYKATRPPFAFVPLNTSYAAET